MRLVQAELVREAGDIRIASHLTSLTESAFIAASDGGAARIALVSGCHMVLVHDPAAVRDRRGDAVTAKTYAVPWTHFERTMPLRTPRSRDDLKAAILIRKGPPS
jgi:hypothetical protein